MLRAAQLAPQHAPAAAPAIATPRSRPRTCPPGSLVRLRPPRAGRARARHQVCLAVPGGPGARPRQLVRAPDRPEQAADQAPRAVLAFSPTARVVGSRGPPGAAASGGQLTNVLARPKRHAGRPAWMQRYQKRPASSPHALISTLTLPPPPAPSEAPAPGAPLRHVLHGSAKLTHAPRSSAGKPPAMPQQPSHPSPHHGLAPHAAPQGPLVRLLPPRAGSDPGPTPGMPCRVGRTDCVTQAARPGPRYARTSPGSSPACCTRVFTHSTSARLSWAAGRRGVRGPTDARVGEAQAPRRETRLDPATPETPRQQPPRPHLGSHASPPTGC
jgi:hypothetical protein